MDDLAHMHAYRTETNGPPAHGVNTADTKAAGRTDDLTQWLHRIPAILAAGLICGLMAAMFSISAAALLFSSVLSEHIAVAIGICLFTTVVLSAVIALTSSYPGMVSVTQEVTIITLAVMAASLNGAIGDTHSEADILATVIVTIGIATSATGLALFAMGALRLGRLIRFIPYPVIGGFLAGMGWLIVTGAMAVVVDTPLTLQTLPALVHPAELAKWVPAVAFALAVDTLSRREGRSLVLPIAIAGALILFHAGVWMLDMSVPQLQQSGWLFQPPPGDQIPVPLLNTSLTGVDWQVVWAEAPKMIALIAISATSVLFASSGIELSIKCNVDLDRELRAAGLANILAGAGGGAAGFQGLGLTILGHQLGAPYRILGILVAGTCAALLFFGAGLLSYVPIPLFGGLLIWIGWSLLRDWLISIYSRVSRREYVIVLMIVVLIVSFGLLQGVLAGVFAAAALFTVEYSRVRVVKFAVTGESFHSRIERNDEDREYLNRQGKHTLVLRLQGFVFFGSVHRLHRFISARLADPQAAQIRFLVLDCRDVTGLDSSATLSVIKICEMVAEIDGRVIVANLNGAIRDQLTHATASGDGALPMLCLAELDQAVAWCEDRLLHEWQERPAPGETDTIAEQLARELNDPEAFRIMQPYLEKKELAARTRLIHQGDQSQDIFFVERGRIIVELTAPGEAPIHLRTLGPGTIIGEISFFLQQRRTASATTQTPTTVWQLSQENLIKMTRQDPEISYAFHRYLLRILSERLNQTNRLVRSLTD